jgi:glycosyltransferase involved in cell wall biosynthesis
MISSSNRIDASHGSGVALPSRVALIHDWLTTYAGAEKVIEQMLAVFPAAEVHALVEFLSEQDRTFLGGRSVRTTFLQKMPFAKKKYRGYLPLMPLAVEQHDLSDYDVILSSSHAVAKGVVTRADQLHISYVHTPIRYAWDLQHQYLREAKLTWGLRSVAVRMILHYMRLWDRASADRVDVFVANSAYVARRIAKIYRRPAEVIYPPVDLDAFQFQSQKEDYYVTASRIVPYKKVDLIVEAFRSMPSRKLVVIGAGPGLAALKVNCPANVDLRGFQPDDVLRETMRNAKAFVFAADEDFGITPVEAQACGTPVIAFGKGGVLETVVEGETGTFFVEQTPQSLVAAVERFDDLCGAVDPHVVRSQAEKFGIDRFRRELADCVARHWQEFCVSGPPQTQKSPEFADVR